MSSTRFGTWLKQKREQYGLSMNALAQRAGKTHATISSIESGKTASFSREMVVSLARALSDDSATQDILEADALVSAGYLPAAGIQYNADPDTVNITVEGLHHLDTATRNIAVRAAQQAAAAVVEGMVEVNRQIRKQRSEGFGEDRYPETQGLPAARLVDTSEPYIVDIKPAEEQKTKLGVPQRSPRPADAHPIPED